MQILIIYDFEIFYRLNNKNSMNELSRRLDYKIIIDIIKQINVVVKRKIADAKQAKKFN